MSDVELPDMTTVEHTFYSLTVWTPTLSMQIRESEVAVNIMDSAWRSSEDGHPATMTHDEARKIRDLLNMATARGML